MADDGTCQVRDAEKALIAEDGCRCYNFLEALLRDTTRLARPMISTRPSQRGPVLLSPIALATPSVMWYTLSALNRNSSTL